VGFSPSQYFFYHIIFLHLIRFKLFKVSGKLNCGNLLTPHRVYSEFFFKLNPSLHAVSDGCHASRVTTHWAHVFGLEFDVRSGGNVTDATRPYWDVKCYCQLLHFRRCPNRVPDQRQRHLHEKHYDSIQNTYPSPVNLSSDGNLKAIQKCGMWMRISSEIKRREMC